MRPDTAFNTHQTVVNAAPESVQEARRRRNFVCDAFGKQPDVAETIPSGEPRPRNPAGSDPRPRPDHRFPAQTTRAIGPPSH